MGITLDIVAERLRGKCSLVHKHSLLNTEINCAKLLQREIVSFEPGVLYIGRVSEFPPDAGNFDKCSFALLINPHHAAPPPDIRKPNILLVTGTSLALLFNTVQDILSSEARYLTGSARLLASLVQGKGIQNVVDIGSVLIAKPMFVRDTSLKLLAHTRNVKVDDMVWNSLVKKGYHTYEDVRKMMNVRAFERLSASSSPVLFKSDRRPGASRVWSKITVGDTIVGHLVVLALENNFSDEDIELVQLIADAVSLEMQKDGNLYNGLRNEGFIKDLLAGKLREPEEIRERLRYLDCKFGNRLYIMTVAFSDTDSSNMPKFFMKDYLSRIISGGTALIYEKHIVIIISCDNEEPFAPELVQKLIVFLAENGMAAGLSSGFSTLTETHRYYKQSLKAIELGLHMYGERVLYQYHDYLFEHMLSTCSDQQNLYQFCHPSIFLLKEYDRKNKSSYLKFLYQYLENVNNPSGVISALNIHRNTLKYRIDKIKSVANINFNDSKQLLLLYLSFQILRYKEGKDFLDP